MHARVTSGTLTDQDDSRKGAKRAKQDKTTYKSRTSLLLLVLRTHPLPSGFASFAPLREFSSVSSRIARCVARHGLLALKYHPIEIRDPVHVPNSGFSLCKRHRRGPILWSTGERSAVNGESNASLSDDSTDDDRRSPAAFRSGHES